LPKKRPATTQADLRKHLLEEARNLNVSLYGIITDPQGGREDTAELQRRVQQAKREKRDAKLWWFALLSCVASVLSALAAWYAVLRIAR